MKITLQEAEHRCKKCKLVLNLGGRKMKNISITTTVKEHVIKQVVSQKQGNVWIPIKIIKIKSDGDVYINSLTPPTSGEGYHEQV